MAWNSNRGRQGVYKMSQKRALIICGGFFVPFLCFLVTIYNSYPQIEGEIYLKNAPNECSIKTDVHGIPHINAKDEKSGYYAMGYMHAQNRLWQMHLLRMSDQGRISEIFGSKYSYLDRIYRSLGIHHSAKIAAKYMPSDLIQILTSYAKGVNDYVSKCKLLPLEFYLTLSSFEQWTFIDSIATMKRINIQLSSYFRLPLINSYIADNLGEEMAELMNPMKKNNRFEWNKFTNYVVSDEELESIGLLKKRIEGVESPSWIRESMNKEDLPEPDNKPKIDINEREEVTMEGSNAWAISGKYTLSGQPILAADPHLDNLLPSMWFLANLQILDNNTETDYFASGATIPGIPFFMLGRTKHIAWGVTNLMAENVDIYYEKLNTTHALYDGLWEPLTIRNERIKVRWGSDIDFIVKSTRNGPYFDPKYIDNVVASAFKIPKEIAGTKPISIKWVGFEDKDTTLMGMYNAGKAKNAQEVFEACKLITGMAVNIIFTTSSGDIGYTPVGTFPKRDKLSSPYYVKPGWDPKFSWSTYIEQSKYPRILNPKKGYIVSTNNPITTYNSEFPIGYITAPNSRNARVVSLIQQQINSKSKITSEFTKTMQNDVFDIYVSALLPLLLQYVKNYLRDVITEPTEVKVVESFIEILEGWDYKVVAEGEPTLIYEVWEILMKRSLLLTLFPGRDQLRTYLLRPYQGNDHFFFRTLYQWVQNPAKTIQQQDWCESPAWKDSKDPCKSLIIRSLYNVNDFLQEHAGNRKNWNWGILHSMEFRHIPMSNVPLLSWVFHRSYPAPGNARTINLALFDEGAKTLSSTNSANLRLIVDFGDIQNEKDSSFKSFMAIDTGEAGNILSEFYDNMLGPFIQGVYYPIPTDTNRLKDIIGELHIKVE